MDVSSAVSSAADGDIDGDIGGGGIDVAWGVDGCDTGDS